MPGPSISVVQAAPIQNPNFGVNVPIVLQHRPMSDRPPVPRVVPPADMFDANVTTPLRNLIPGTDQVNRRIVMPWHAWRDGWRSITGR